MIDPRREDEARNENEVKRLAEIAGDIITDERYPSFREYMDIRISDLEARRDFELMEKGGDAIEAKISARVRYELIGLRDMAKAHERNGRELEKRTSEAKPTPEG